MHLRIVLHAKKSREITMRGREFVYQLVDGQVCFWVFKIFYGRISKHVYKKNRRRKITKPIAKVILIMS